MNKILFIGSLNTKRNRFDGERIKTTLTLQVLSRYFDIDIVNLSKFKLINTIKFIFCVSFFKKKYKYIVISKDRGGAKTLHKILSAVKYNMNKVIYFQIGPFLFDLIKENAKLKRLFSNDFFITVETESLKAQLNSIDLFNVKVLPNFKQNHDLQFLKMEYPKKILRLIYFSRIEEMKGIYQLIESLIELNQSFICFELDIYGIFMSNKDKDAILRYTKDFNWINYLGAVSLDSNCMYMKLQQYDLHVFPTLYGEGFPGSIIDFFIAGVPTLSSNFARSKEILTDNETIYYKQGDAADLMRQLLYIYSNQHILNKMREKAFSRRNEFTLDVLDSFIKKEMLD